MTPDAKQATNPSKFVWFAKRQTPLLFGAMLMLLAIVGYAQSWNLAFSLLNMCLVSAIMSIGVNMQWGYAGLFNAGVMGFAAVGGLAAVLVSMAPVPEALAAGGAGMFGGLAVALVSLAAGLVLWRRLAGYGRWRYLVVGLVALVGYFSMRALVDPAISAIEAVDPARTGYLGGLGLPVLWSWLVGGIFAAIIAYFIGKLSLGLRSDYLAIATLGISEIIVYVLKFEDWLTRGVKNVNGLPRPVPYEVDLQAADWFRQLASGLGMPLVEASALFVKICYAGLFIVVIVALLWFSETALR
ncbi:MAG: branched-chain amino acid ABC transporter permease, partial [Candidatus Puniceispirillum sp.]